MEVKSKIVWKAKGGIRSVGLRDSIAVHKERQSGSIRLRAKKQTLSFMIMSLHNQ